MSAVEFTVLGHPQPQGSTRAYLVKGKPRVTGDNFAMKPWRQEVGWAALRARADLGVNDVFAGRQVPVQAYLRFFFAPPKKIPRGRTLPAVKPDLDKVTRSIFDALSGVLWVDDAQVVGLMATKSYGLPERAEVRVETVKES